MYNLFSSLKINLFFLRDSCFLEHFIHFAEHSKAHPNPHYLAFLIFKLKSLLN